jgi:hypothetical protein
MRVSIEKGDSPTLTYVYVGPLAFAFSYETIVAFNRGFGWRKSENVWSKTTGKHLNEIPGKHISHEEFSEQLEQLTRDIVFSDSSIVPS